jgi:transcriptional regulator with XRE-family HTH domain
MDQDMSETNALSMRLKKLRKSKQLTLTDLAGLSGVSASTISKIENGNLSPTYDVIIRLSRGLDIAISQLVADEGEQVESRSVPNGRFALAKKGQDVLIETQNYDYHYLCSNLKHKRMFPFFARMKANSKADFGDLYSHDGEEFLYVLKGSIEVHTEYYETTRLSEGEGVYLDSTMAHGYVSAGDEDAEVLCICTNPNMRDDIPI